MTLVASLASRVHGLESSSFGEDSNMPGILKSGFNRRTKQGINVYDDAPADHNQGNEDAKRLVRFRDTEERVTLENRKSVEEDEQEVIMLGSNMYFINNSDPNSAVRKLFPNSKRIPNNPSLNKQPKPVNIIKPTPLTLRPFENDRTTRSRTKSRSYLEEKMSGVNVAKKKMDRNTLVRNSKVSREQKNKKEKHPEPPTPLIERIKQLTLCDIENESTENIEQKQKYYNYSPRKTFEELQSSKTYSETNQPNPYKNSTRDFQPKLKDNIKSPMTFKDNISTSKLHNTSEDKTSRPTEEAKRSFPLSEHVEGKACLNLSKTSMSTNTDSVYTLSDIEEALTEEEKEIREAFANDINQDELELFVQQDAGRTERLRKRYVTTPNQDNTLPMLFTNNSYPQITTDIQNYSTNTMKKDRPKFGSTIEILQQLQQQIETPYQLEGRRTACSNYSDSSIPISDRLFYDESSDGYEPLIPKSSVQRTSSLDFKTYEEIDNFPSAFSAPRTKSHEHPHLTNYESNNYFYPSQPIRNSCNFLRRHHSQEQNVYTSSPNLYDYHYNPCPDRFGSYNNLSANKKQLHPVLHKQYCRYPLDSNKILTPPNRMHTYMNVPTNTSPRYLPPPPYPRGGHSANINENSQYKHSNIYQNIPPPMNHHLLGLRKLCFEKERGVPEGASSSQDSNETYTNQTALPKECQLRPNTTFLNIPSTLHQYCVDV